MGIGNTARILALHALSSFLLAFGVQACAFDAAAPPSARPNIVLVLADDLGWADLACYGADLHETPHLDQLAREGVRFTQAYAPSPVCSPTRAALLTGKAPARLNITIWSEGSLKGPADRRLLQARSLHDLPHGETTLAKLLQGAGYMTALVGKWHLGDADHAPETHGFDVNIGGTRWGAPQTYFFPYSGSGRFGGEFRYVPHLELGMPGEYLTDRLTDEALRVVDRAAARRQPFFLYLAHHAPHTPIEAKPADIAHFQAKLRPGLRHRNPVYAAMLRSLDESVGRVRARIRDRGLEEDTIFIFTSDNGGYIGTATHEGRALPVTDNAPLRSGKGTCYEGGLRIPLIVKWPGITPAGAVCHEPVILTDLFHTLAAVAPGEARDAVADGIDLAPLLRNPAATLEREALFFHYPHYYHAPPSTPVGAVRAGDWKLLEFFEDQRVELYNLKDDPGERRDLAAATPGRVAELRRRLGDWRAAVGAQMPAPNPAFTGDAVRDGTRLALEDYLDWEDVADARISPDATRILYTRRWVNRIEDRWDSSIWILDADGGRNRFLVDGAGARWSPRGDRIAFLAKDGDGRTQVFVRWMDAEGAVSQVTRVLRTPSNPRWSPDGSAIAFAMAVPVEESWEIELPPAPEGARWTKAPRVIDRIHYRQDGTGFLDEGPLHIFVVPADGGTPRQMTRGRWSVGARPIGLLWTPGFDWLDARTIVFDGLVADDADARYRESHLYAVDVRTGAIRQITREKGLWHGPVVSPIPEGGAGVPWIAFTGFPWNEQSCQAEDLRVIRPDGSDMRVIASAETLDRDPQDLHWDRAGTQIYFTAQDRGAQHLHVASLDGAVRRLTVGRMMLSLDSIAGGKGIGIRTAPDVPREVVRIALGGAAAGEVTRLLAVNDEILSGKRLGEVEEIGFEAPGGPRCQGWIVKPPDFDPGKTYPLILHIHGGPHAMYGVGFQFSFQHFAASGHIVLYSNPRGSTGYGTAFGNAIDKAYPGVDYDDLMAGVDAVLARGSIDANRLYVTGASGGGVLSIWITTRTDRFAAAAVRAPVTNWLSFAGTTDIPLWGYHRFRPYPWEDPEAWLRHSPLMHVGKVKTPTLLMTGELDLRTPMGQTEEYYQALKVRGVPAVLLRFHDEYHGTQSKPTNFMRTQLYILDWFGRYPQPAPSRS